MYANKVEICGINTSKLPVMKDVEMKDMIGRIRSGDRKLREEFITGNLRLVLSVIQKFQNRGESMDDLFQVGCIGLIKALDNFDPSHEVKFSTYAVPMNVRRRGKAARKNIRPSPETIGYFFCLRSRRERTDEIRMSVRYIFTHNKLAG